MNRRVFHFAIALLWLAFPIVAIQYQIAWDRLPASMAVHFNAANQANGWMTRQQSLDFNLGMIAIVLVVSTLILAIASWKSITGFSWTFLGFFGVLLAFLLSVNQSVISYNLYGTPIHPERVVILVGLAVGALIAVYLFSNRHVPLPNGDTFTVETHASRLWGAVILVAMLGPIVAMALAPGTVRIPMILVAVIGIFAFVMAWAGFQYQFMQHGVEIRLLGFRLRSIPRSAIVSYAIEPWAFMRGYGIRGIGSTRAYVWCNQVVHIRTTNGDVYLGHNDPAQIVRDLDQMMSDAVKA